METQTTNQPHDHRQCAACKIKGVAVVGDICGMCLMKIRQAGGFTNYHYFMFWWVSVLVSIAIIVSIYLRVKR